MEYKTTTMTLLPLSLVNLCPILATSLTVTWPNWLIGSFLALGHGMYWSLFFMGAGHHSMSVVGIVVLVIIARWLELFVAWVFIGCWPLLAVCCLLWVWLSSHWVVEVACWAVVIVFGGRA